MIEMAVGGSAGTCTIPQCEKEMYLPQLRHHRAALLEDVGGVLLIDEVGEMVLQCFLIAAFLLILENLDDD